jgi:hypothetical protein
MAANISGRFVSILIILIMILSGFWMIFTPAETDVYGASVYDTSSRDEQDDYSELQQSWELSEEIQKTIQVQKGNDYFFYLNTTSGLLGEKILPPPDAGLNKISQDALGVVPDWLHDDLALKFRETASVQIIVNSNNAAPCLADLDNDGDMDLTLGQSNGGLIFFQNEGTAYQPIFVRDDTLFSTLNTLSSEFFDDFFETIPTSADVDSDFDNDLIVGTFDGNVFFFENTGSPTEPKFDKIESIPTINIDDHAAPSLSDTDGDGDFDLVIGEGSGRIQHYANLGTPTNPQWNRAIPNRFSEIIVNGEAAPFLTDLDFDGDLDVTVGDTTDRISYYRNTAAQYVLDETMYFGLTLVENNHPILGDIDNDGLVEFLSGNGYGEINFYENYGNIFNPSWKIWSSYQAVPGVGYYPPYEYIQYLNFPYIDKYAQLILDAYKTNPLWVDEVAFAIAHTAKDLLRGMYDDQAHLFLDNAKLLYDIDKHLAYADIKEYNSGTKDYYSTVKYKTLENGIEYNREYPRDIYYWYIVHPKITEEYPGYIDPDTGNMLSPDDGGWFWREYLFFEHDQTYPPDMSGSAGDGIDDYPTAFGPPMLKDLLSGVKYLWNSTKWVAPGGRDELYGNHALIRVSNWVGKTLILNQQEVSDEERPTQPVRIAHHHNGNCGELQDLSVAAARTALIPASGVNLVAEDHVWNEFYEDGWKHWDNHWSDAGSHIDRYNMYWSGWGKRGGSGIWKHRGDDDTIDVTYKYIPPESQSRVIVTVRDRWGSPVDGARVIFGSHWMAENSIEQTDVTFPFPGIWNYTDINGMSEFRLAKQFFSIKVISKLGNAFQNKTYIGEGGTYYFNFTLEGVKPHQFMNVQEIGFTPPKEPTYKVDLDFQVLDGVQHPPNPESRFYHPEVQERSNLINFFVTGENDFEAYQQGLSFSVIDFEGQISSYSNTEFLFEEGNDWYFVLSNLDTIETAKNVKITMKLYRPQRDEPYVVINSPLNNSDVFAGAEVRIEGIAQDEDGIKSVGLKLKDMDKDIIIISTPLPHLEDNSWYYEWDTKRYDPGIYIVEVTAEDNKGFVTTARIFLNLILAGAPEVVILNPAHKQQFLIGDLIEFNGSCIDNGFITELTITFGSGSPKNILSSFENGLWQTSWNTQSQTEGLVEARVAAVDDDGKIGTDSILIELQKAPIPPDTKQPEVSIILPTHGDEIELGSTVKIAGFAYDDRELDEAYLIIRGGNDKIDLAVTDDGKWSYEWLTSSETPGQVLISIYGKDASGNIGTTNVTVEITAPPPPVDKESPKVIIKQPADDTPVSAQTSIIITGTAQDDIGINQLELSYDNEHTWYDLLDLLSGTSWQFVIDTSNPLLWPDSYDIIVRAFDKSGNMGKAEATINIVDDTIPELEILSPTDGSTYKHNEIIQINGFATDNFQVEKILLKLNDERRWRDIRKSYNSDTGSWLIDLESSELIRGSNNIRIKAVDLYGNENEQSLRVSIQSAPKEEPSKDTLESTLEYLMFDTEGMLICGAIFIIIIIAAFAVLRSRRYPIPKSEKIKNRSR